MPPVEAHSGMGARHHKMDPVLAKALDPSFSECSAHGKNVVLMTGVRRTSAIIASSRGCS